MKNYIEEMMRNSRKAMLDNAHKEMMERCSKVDYEIIINKKCEHCKDLGAKYVGVKLGHLRCPICGKM